MADDMDDLRNALNNVPADDDKDPDDTELYVDSSGYVLPPPNDEDYDSSEVIDPEDLEDEDLECSSSEEDYDMSDSEDIVNYDYSDEEYSDSEY